MSNTSLGGYEHCPGDPDLSQALLFRPIEALQDANPNSRNEVPAARAGVGTSPSGDYSFDPDRSWKPSIDSLAAQRQNRAL